MIAPVMVFLLTVSALTVAAAWVAEWGARRAGLPTRGIWLASMLAPWVLLLAPLAPTGEASPLVGGLGGVLTVQLPGLVVRPDSVGGLAPWLTPALAATWIGGSAVLTLVLLVGHWRLRTDRKRWATGDVAGRRVFLSPDHGPAVGGVLRPWIVLPRWSLELRNRELSLVVLHEEEHIRGGDPALLTVSLLLLALTPWNPFTWVAITALRTAVEVDCDRRVLSRTSDADAYGESLISVAARSSGFSLGLAAFTEKGRTLEKRIVAMTHKRPRASLVTTLLCLVCAGLLGIQACSVESPAEIFDGNGQAPGAATPASPDAQAPEEKVLEVRELPAGEAGTEEVFSAREIPTEPSFTPFTEAPSIANRQEVVAAMADAYPPLLRDAGIGGRVIVWFFIDEEGRVLNTRLQEGSGHEALDRAAMQVADVYRFEPARNGDEAVAVWVQFPITFVTR
ncbi:MAG: M56 family metallopeptidase [Longimicrobiales bacterium]|nr:M56 family metallopeptidase [Longimicrobiales bacterium]